MDEVKHYRVWSALVSNPAKFLFFASQDDQPEWRKLTRIDGDHCVRLMLRKC